MSDYILAVDQSTQGTKALLFDRAGCLLKRADAPHRQLVNEQGWVEHDPQEIYSNTLQAVKLVVEQAGIDKGSIRALGISNQRETALVWERSSGRPVYNAIVWQCARGAGICQRLEAAGKAELVRANTGLALSPYFSAAKIAWVLENVEGAAEQAKNGELCCGTMDSWLVYRLTGGKQFRTDYSNASRTQLFHIRTLSWDEEVCGLFGVPVQCLAKVTDSDGYYGETDLDGFLDKAIPICGVMGDSNGALFGQGCWEKGMTKATYGTGSSVMMNIGKQPVFCSQAVTSLAWGMGGTVSYVLEGNINYTGAVVTWMKDELHLIDTPSQTQKLARQANPKDQTYLVPAFSGLGAPYWDSGARAVFYGMSRTTGRAELVKAGLESIGYQITDVLQAMEEESKIVVQELRADGGPTRNAYLMQFQSDMAQLPVYVPKDEELSGIGAAYVAGLAVGVYQKETLFDNRKYTQVAPLMNEEERERKYQGWKEAVCAALKK